MPIVDTDQLKYMLKNGQIDALTLDSDRIIGTGRRVNLNQPNLRVLARFRNKSITFILSSTIWKEILKHLKDDYENDFRVARKSIKEALRSFGTAQSTLDSLLDQITGGSNPPDAATKRWDRFIQDTNCKVLEDVNYIDMASIMDDYFAINPPFENKKDKKCEFPDAIALNAIEAWAMKRGLGILVVSGDKGWKNFCENSDILFYLERLDQALALINKAPIELMKAIHVWLEDESTGRNELFEFLINNVNEVDFQAWGFASFGQMESHAFMGELENIVSLDGIYIIENIEDKIHKCVKVTISLDLILKVLVPIHLSFHVWDSIDRDSVDMGVREIEHEQQLNTTATVVLDICNFGSEDEMINLVKSELDINSYDIDLGEVGVFTPEDYD